MTKREFFNQIYLDMGIGLLITALTSLGLYVISADTIYNLFTGSQAKWFLLITMLIQLGLVFYISSQINSNKSNTKYLFYLYSFINGLTFSVIFLAFKMGAIFSIFLITSLMFFGLSFYGRTTKRDLTGMGRALITLLIGVILVSIANIFLRWDFIPTITAYLNVFIFSGLIAYDNQKLESFYKSRGANQGLVTYGALILYLDFVNLFLNLLKIFGKRK